MSSEVIENSYTEGRERVKRDPAEARLRDVSEELK